ncbi:DUF2157 domain-containing protein [Exiguobacterium flavidum]|uniref:DUF2157 domain-containing protein n=1 Tax=Exiguobacterium flavidum TaxID=2184695 RepID=UPI000DF7C7F6|nr:DUF2157 domain-containing protein [Exiguobacterium flavidum]
MSWQTKLKEWEDAGVIDAGTKARVFEYEGKLKREKKRFPLLVVIGLIFVALAIMSFIAANWQAIPALVKIGLVLLLMWAFYVLADVSERRKIWSPVAFRILGIISFAGAIVVTVQTFHMSQQGTFLAWAVLLMALGHYFLWRHEAYTIVAFIAGINLLTTAGQSVTWLEWALLLAVGLAWFYFSQKPLPQLFSWIFLFGSGVLLWSLVDGYDGVLWAIWTLFALVPLLFLIKDEEARKKFVPIYLFVGGAASVVYLAVRGGTEDWTVDMSYYESAALLLVALAIGYVGYRWFKPLLWLVPLGLFGFALYDDTAIALAAIIEIVAFAFLIYSERKDHSLVMPFVYFIAVQMAIYFVYAWDRLDMSLFFLIGAIIVFLLAGIAWWLRRRREGATT